MPNFNPRAKWKLAGGLSVLGVVLFLAGVAQWSYEPGLETSIAEADEESRTPERTVYGERPSPVSDSPAPPIPVEQQRSRSRPASRVPEARPAAPAPVRSEGVPADIHAFLAEWQETLRQGDLERQTSLYAPRVQVFFNASNVTRDDVRREKRRMLNRYPVFDKYEISDIQIESNEGGQAAVTFRKEWDARGAKRFAGAERQRLRLNRIDGSWKIVSEEELKVYWVKRA